MSAIDVDATMAPMDYEVMTDNEPILETKKQKNKKNKTKLIWDQGCLEEAIHI